MKPLYVIMSLIFGIIINCNAQNTFTESQQKEFEKTAQTFQTKYIQGSENYEYIIQAFDEKVEMSENRFSEQIKMTFEQLVQFFPHLPNKEVINTVT